MVKLSLNQFYGVFFDVEDFLYRRAVKKEDFKSIDIYLGDPDPKTGEITFEVSYPKYYKHADEG